MEDRNFLAGIAYLGQIIRAKGIENSIDLLKIDTFNLGDVPEYCYEMADTMLYEGGTTKVLEVGDVVKYKCKWAEERDECQNCIYKNKEGVITRITLDEDHEGKKYKNYAIKLNCVEYCWFRRDDLIYVDCVDGVK